MMIRTRTYRRRRRAVALAIAGWMLATMVLAAGAAAAENTAPEEVRDGWAQRLTEPDAAPLRDGWLVQMEARAPAPATGVTDGWERTLTADRADVGVTDSWERRLKAEQAPADPRTTTVGSFPDIGTEAVLVVVALTIVAMAAVMVRQRRHRPRAAR